jgi:hypothetical protein
MARTLKYLRIAVTALNLTACVLLFVLWLRSYTCHDGVWGRFSDAQGFHLSSHEGRVQLALMQNLGIVHWRIVCGEPIDRVGPPDYFPAFEFPRASFGLYFAVPHWALVGCTTVTAAIVFKRRFSVRTLLIATTLVAVALGIVIGSNSEPTAR